MIRDDNDIYMMESNKFVVFRQGQSIYFFDEINNSTVAECIKLMQQIVVESEEAEIQLVLNTPGGTVYDGLALYDYLIRLSNPLTVIGTGLIASMGVLILLAGQRRFMTKTARLMSHQIATQVQGKVSDLKIDFNETNELETICVNIISERTGQSIKTIQKEIKIGDKYFSANDALKNKYIHKII